MRARDDDGVAGMRLRGMQVRAPKKPRACGFLGGRACDEAPGDAVVKKGKTALHNSNMGHAQGMSTREGFAWFTDSVRAMGLQTGREACGWR